MVNLCGQVPRTSRTSSLKKESRHGTAERLDEKYGWLGGFATIWLSGRNIRFCLKSRWMKPTATAVARLGCPQTESGGTTRFLRRACSERKYGLGCCDLGSLTLRRKYPVKFAVFVKNALLAFCVLTSAAVGAADTGPVLPRPQDDSPLAEKAKWFQQKLVEKHWLDGLYVSITPTAPDGVHLSHTVDTSGNVIHSGVWTGRLCRLPMVRRRQCR